MTFLHSDSSDTEIEFVKEEPQLVYVRTFLTRILFMEVNLWLRERK